MKTTTLSCFLASIGFVVFLATRGEAAETDADVKRIAVRVNAVETQLDRAIFYERTTEDAAAESKLTERAWFTEAGDWLKIQEERVSKAGRQLTEMWFDKGDALTFRLRREETPAKNGATEVLESRCYYDEDSLIRELRKSAVFKAGEPLETKPIKNVSRPVDKLPDEERPSSKQQEAAAKYLERLVKAGAPKRDPSADAGGDSARFRLIRDSASPDGRFAVGFGFADAPKSWDGFYLRDDEVTGRPEYWIDQDLRDNLRNYIVDLATHRIIGETEGGAYCTLSSAPNGRDDWSHDWSPDGRWLVQVTSDKWSSSGKIFAMDQEKGAVGSADFIEPAQSRALAFLTAKKDPTLKRLGRDIAVRIHSVEVTNDGRMTLDLLPTQPGSPASWESPSLIERFQLSAKGKEVGVKFVEVRYDE